VHPNPDPSFMTKSNVIDLRPVHPSPGPSFVTKLNVTDVCHVTASIASDVNNNDDGPLVSKPIFELSQSVGPFFEPAHQKNTLKIEPINSIQFLIPYTRMIITAKNTYQILAA